MAIFSINNTPTFKALENLQLPLDLMAKGLIAKQKSYDEVFENLNKNLPKILSLDVLNKKDQSDLDEINKSVSEVYNNMSNLDLTDNKNLQNIYDKIYTPLIENTSLRQGVKETMQIKSSMSKISDKDKNSVNYANYTRRIKDYIETDNPRDTYTNLKEFVPYYDIKTDLEKCKAKNMVASYTDGYNNLKLSDGESISQAIEYIKNAGISANRIKNCLKGNLTSTAFRQFQEDAEYYYRSNPDIKQEQIEKYNLRLNENSELALKQIEINNEEIRKLDPSSPQYNIDLTSLMNENNDLQAYINKPSIALDIDDNVFISDVFADNLQYETVSSYANGEEYEYIQKKLETNPLWKAALEEEKLRIETEYKRGLLSVKNREIGIQEKKMQDDLIKKEKKEKEQKDKEEGFTTEPVTKNNNIPNLKEEIKSKSQNVKVKTDAAVADFNKLTSGNYDYTDVIYSDKINYDKLTTSAKKAFDKIHNISIESQLLNLYSTAISKKDKESVLTLANKFLPNDYLNGEYIETIKNIDDLKKLVLLSKTDKANDSSYPTRISNFIQSLSQFRNDFNEKAEDIYTFLNLGVKHTLEKSAKKTYNETIGDINTFFKKLNLLSDDSYTEEDKKQIGIELYNDYYHNIGKTPEQFEKELKIFREKRKNNQRIDYQSIYFGGEINEAFKKLEEDYNTINISEITEELIFNQDAKTDDTSPAVLKLKNILSGQIPENSNFISPQKYKISSFNKSDNSITFTLPSETTGKIQIRNKNGDVKNIEVNPSNTNSQFTTYLTDENSFDFNADIQIETILNSGINDEIQLAIDNKNVKIFKTSDNSFLFSIDGNSQPLIKSNDFTYIDLIRTYIKNLKAKNK